MLLNKLNNLSRLHLARKKARGYQKKIRNILSGLNYELATVDVSSMSIRKHFPSYSNTDWHVTLASVNGITSPDYLPEDLYYTKVEPALNNYNYGLVFSDKTSLGFILEENDYVGNSFHFNNGQLFDRDGNGVEPEVLRQWVLEQDEIVCKPSKESGGGRGVVIGSGEEILAKIESGYENCVIQKVLKQHPIMEQLHPGSLNTMRLVTLRKNGKIHLVSSTIRMGVGDARIDNGTRGGVSCGIVDGNFRKVGFGLSLIRISEHPDTKVVFDGIRVPNWDKVVDLVTRNHQKLTELDILSWDIGIDHQGVPKIVEVNVFEQEINMHQVMNGPVFAPYIDYLFSRT